jgi:hypothetical protein
MPGKQTLLMCRHGLVEPDLLLCPFSAPTPTESALFTSKEIEHYLDVLKSVAPQMARLLNIPVIMANKVCPHNIHQQYNTISSSKCSALLSRCTSHSS